MDTGPKIRSPDPAHQIKDQRPTRGVGAKRPPHGAGRALAIQGIAVRLSCQSVFQTGWVGPKLLAACQLKIVGFSRSNCLNCADPQICFANPLSPAEAVISAKAG